MGQAVNLPATRILGAVANSDQEISLLKQIGDLSSSDSVMTPTANAGICLSGIEPYR